MGLLCFTELVSIHQSSSKIVKICELCCPNESIENLVQDSGEDQ